MKKILLSILCLCLLFYFSGCTKQNNQNYLNSAVASQLEKLDNNYSDETLKAISVVLRTNYILDNDQKNENKYSNKKYLDIVNKTSNQTLNNNKNKMIKVNLFNNNIQWQNTIKKSELLEYAKDHNKNLVNVSNIEPIYNNDRVVSINIGNTIFDYTSFADRFNLTSNKIDKIDNLKDKITIYGNEDGFYDNFNYEKAEQLSNNNYNYEDILNEFYGDLKVI